MSAPPKRTIRATETSLDILEYLQENDGSTLAELESDFDIVRSTIYTHLHTLQQRNYVVKDGECYHLGLKLFNLGESAKRDDRYALVERTVRELANQTGEAVDFSVPDDDRVIVLFDDAHAGVRQGFQKGEYFYMHTGASGKAFLAEYSTERVNEIIDRWGLPALTETTISDRDRLFEELEQIRDRGYAYNNQENLEGMRAISAVVHNPDGSILGALSIYGPAYRLNQSEMDDLATVLLENIDKLESEFTA